MSSEKDREYAARRYHARREAGLCTTCGVVASPGFSNCEACAAKRAEYQREIHGYRPIEESKSRPRARLLSALQWRECATFDRLMIQLGVECTDGGKISREYAAHAQAIYQLVRRGFVLRSGIRGSMAYALTERGRAEVKRFRRGDYRTIWQHPRSRVMRQAA